MPGQSFALLFYATLKGVKKKSPKNAFINVRKKVQIQIRAFKNIIKNWSNKVIMACLQASMHHFWADRILITGVRGAAE